MERRYLTDDAPFQRLRDDIYYRRYDDAWRERAILKIRDTAA